MSRRKLFRVRFVITVVIAARLTTGMTTALADELDHNPLVPLTEGERYETMIPDSLDIAERLRLSVNALTNVWIPDERYALQFVVDFSRRPAVAMTNHRMDAYLNIPPKFIEALVVSRYASGSKQSIDVDLGILKSQLELIAEDGLGYCPVDTLGGHKFSSMGHDETTPYAETWAEGRTLLALAMLAQIDDDPRWVELGKRKVDTLLSMMRQKDGIHFLWDHRFPEGYNVPDDPEIPGGFHEIYIIGALGQGTGLFYRVTGYKPALELSGKLADWALARVFNSEDGRYPPIHFHHGLMALMAVCEYGIASGDRKALERVDACYRWTRSLGDPLIGFFPEAMPGTDWYLGRQGNTVEICEVSDMVWLALKLTRAGIGNYWDDVDRWVRNMYAEGQLCRTDLVTSIPDSYFNPAPHNYTFASERRIAERMVGSFWGWMRANEGLQVDRTPNGPKLSDASIMHCCTANGVRGLYAVWDSIVSQEGELTQVNLLLNRVSKPLDVHSYLPAEGKVELQIKSASKVAIRMPDWVDLETVDVQVDGQSTPVQIDGRCVHVYLLAGGSIVTCRFDVPRKNIFRVVGEIPYKLTVRGSNVVHIDPPGVAYPLFISQPSGRLIEKAAFISAVDGPKW